MTNRRAFDDLRAAGADVQEAPLVVDDGDVVPAAGLTAGIDLAIRLVSSPASSYWAPQVPSIWADTLRRERIAAFRQVVPGHAKLATQFELCRGPQSWSSAPTRAPSPWSCKSYFGGECP